MSSAPNNEFLSTAIKVDTVAKENLIRPNPRRDDAITNSDKNGLPPITVSALQGQYLAVQARLIGAKSVLEVGTLGGYSTTFFAEAGCHVTSIEISPKHRDVALQNIAHVGHRQG